MLRSMTGFGQAELETERFVVKVEFKSLNNKFLELNLRFPKGWQNKETELRKELNRLVERGSCQVNVNVVFKLAEDKVLPLNKDVARFYLNELTDVVKEFNLGTEHIVHNMMGLPNLFQQTVDENREEDLKVLMDVVNKAFVEFEKFRIKEGEMLSDELNRMTQAIMQLVREVEVLEPERIDSLRTKIDQELQQISEASYDKNRFEQELLYYIEKFDVTEERTRLIQHCQYFLETMHMKSSGKKLGFIAQEMGREINTMGSKANHFKIQQRVVEMKDELEKIKEQINNVI